MKRELFAAMAAMLISSQVSAADFKTLRNLQAPLPVTVTPLPADAKADPIRLSKVVLQPRQGESWALIYRSILVSDPDNPPPKDELLPWQDSRMEGDRATFERIKGIVSATRTYEGQPFIQSDVTVNHGNSGGPLIDEDGAVIGVTMWGVQLGEAPAGVNFFIPIGDALKALALTPIP